MDEILVVHEGIVDGKSMYEVYVNSAAVSVFCSVRKVHLSHESNTKSFKIDLWLCFVQSKD